jgi:hypothetical protein
MSYSRFLVLPVVAGSTLLLMGSLGTVHPSGTSRPEQHLEVVSVALSAQLAQSAPAAPDAQAGATFEKALAPLDPSRLAWLETKLWQQMHTENITCEAEGRFLSGPGHRFRLDLTTRHGATAGTIQVVSDGSTLWRATRTGKGKWTRTSRVRLKDVLPLLNRPDTSPVARDEFYQDQGCGGLPTLLPSLRQRVDWVRKEAVRRNDRLFVKLSGTWAPAVAAALAPADKPWPPHLPRQCRLYLDPGTSWPHRLEWWGPDPGRGDDVLLVEMEFRDPVLNRPLTAEQCAREFRPDADERIMPDVTAEVTQRLKTRIAQLRTAAPRP